MRKIIPLALCAYLCCFGINPTFAKDKVDIKNPDTKVEQKIEIANPDETISVSEMETRLKNNPNDDVLFVKVDKDTVKVYNGTASSRSLRKQIVFGTPAESMIRLYSTNKATAQQIARMLGDYEDDNANINGYRIIMDVDKPEQLENGNIIYKPWFMKVVREKSVRRHSGGGWSFPIGIGIGIWGHHHHHWGIGPRIGIGPRFRPAPPPPRHIVSPPAPIGIRPMGRPMGHHGGFRR
ncbi:MAG: hypothetical protein Q4D21_05990 [Phascolarctobacterium sp.]|nr:hypothetical protein [Phascolarctobacterium sp.]